MRNPLSLRELMVWVAIFAACWAVFAEGISFIAPTMLVWLGGTISVAKLVSSRAALCYACIVGTTLGMTSLPRILDASHLGGQNLDDRLMWTLFGLVVGSGLWGLTLWVGQLSEKPTRM